MANGLSPYFGDEKIERFKSRIHFSKIKINNSDLKLNVNWPDLLKELKLPNGTVWKDDDGDVSIGLRGSNHGNISGYLKNGGKNVHLYVHVFGNKTNKEVIDELIFMSSLNSMVDIGLEYSSEGPGDFYLFGRGFTNEASHKRAKCAYNNVIIEISTTDDEIDVKEIVEHLISEISKRSIEESSPTEPLFVKRYLSQKIVLGEQFWVEVQYKDPLSLENHVINFNFSDIKNNLEFIEESGSRYFFKAINKGVINIDFQVMNTKNLFVENTTFTIEVD